MQKQEFLTRLKTWAATDYLNTKINHGAGAIYDDYPCANPEGAVDNSDCPEDDPLCNCPCQDLKPSAEEQFSMFFGLFSFGDVAEEPTDDEIREKYEKTKECELIEQHLGDEYLGCLWRDPDHPASCNCPCVGEKFKEYLEYDRTYSTYWDTPPEQPLYRDAQMLLINSQRATIVLNGDLSLRPGELININNPADGQDESQQKRFAGPWMVGEINHIITNQNQHRMEVTLHRDSNSVDPGQTEEPGFFASLFGL